jgi:mRNA-degrading endonuclease HigB of HigAB toxin-antitoxin module
MATTKEEEVKVEQPKEVELVIHEVEDNAIIVNVQGWRMRVYYDVDFKSENLRYGQTVSVKYLGDIEDAHTVQFEKLK